MNAGEKLANVQLLNADHKDVIHDVAYNFHGKRMATCSSDQIVKVWDLNEEGQWECTSQWKAHNGSVWKVNWAHPEFGQILATCSFDRTGSVWEEIRTDTAESIASHWVKRNNLVDARADVTDIKFCPRQHGLQLATTSADGYLRIYECPDIMNLTQWTLSCEVNVKSPLSCMCWSSSYGKPPMIAVGSDSAGAAGTSKVFLYDWSDMAGSWVKVESLPVDTPVHDVAFAPPSGRSYSLLAVAATDLKIFVIRPNKGPFGPSAASGGPPVPAPVKYDIRVGLESHDHVPCAWRVSWNSCGSVLSSTGDDGTLRLWKSEASGKWPCILALKADGTKVKPEPGLAPSASEPVLQSRVAAEGRASTAGAEAAAGSSASNARFYRAGGVSQREHVPWH